MSTNSTKIFLKEPSTLASATKVLSGTSRISRNGVISDVAEIILYPTYVPEPPNPINDFALLKLKKPLKFNRSTQPIKLAGEDSELYGDEDVLVVGHGDTKNETQNTEFLRGAVVKIMEFEQCKILYQGTFTVTDSQICTSTDDAKDSCQV